MELQVGVKILLQNKEGKFLFLERNLEKYPEVKKQAGLDPYSREVFEKFI